MLVVSHDFKGLEIRFSAAPANIDRVIDYARLFLEKECPVPQIPCIVTLMRAALSNAVSHGCGADPARTVSCSVKVEKGFLMVEVEDEGPGFNWRSRLNTSDDENPEKRHGIDLLKKYATNLTYNESGNRLCIRKKLD